MDNSNKIHSKTAVTANTSIKWNIKMLTLIGLATAVTCILAPLSVPIPFSPVPLSLTHLAIYFSIYLLGMKKGILSFLIYLLIGLIGIPVFSGFTGGPAKFLGPTGGYLIGFLFLELILGLFLTISPNNIFLAFLGMLLGNAACYLFGTAWLAYQNNLSFSAALAIGVLPFLPGDFIKIIIALIICPQVRKRLNRARFV